TARAPPGPAAPIPVPRSARSSAGDGSSRPPPEVADAQRARRVARRRDVRLGSRGLLLGLLAVLDDVSLLEEDPLGDLAPQRRPSQQELEVHAEVLVLLADGVVHDRPRLRVGLDSQTLLIPADRVRLLRERRAQPCERARL